MSGDWITGAEIIQRYSKLAVEIGQACHDAKLQAYTESLLPILEESKLGHIPKYPPPNVNPYEHIQFTHNPRWDWPEDSSINQEAHAFVRAYKNGLYGGSRQDFCMELSSVRLLMKVSFNYDSNEMPCESRTFCFRIEDFTEWLNEYPPFQQKCMADSPERFEVFACSGRALAAREEAYPFYEKAIKEFLFTHREVNAWLGRSEDDHPAATSDLIPVNIPTSLWAGKTAEAVFTTLSEHQYTPAVIAFIIMEKVGGITKTDAGRLFYQDEIAKGVIQESRTYQRKIDALLSEAKTKYSFTFAG